MQPSLEVEFKTLLSKEEYDRLVQTYRGNKSDYQTNHYLDTPRFSLKASDASLRVRQRDKYELTYKHKKGYNIQELSQPLTNAEFEDIRKTGVLIDCPIKNEVISICGNQKLINFMSLSTERIYFQYGNGVIFIDKSTYLSQEDYELEYEARNYHDGRKEFIQLLLDLNIKYKKAEKKVKRAYNALKALL